MGKFLASLFLIAVMAVSCADPFSSRTSEPPVAEQGTYVQPVTPQIALFNLENAYKEQIISNFLLCLDSGFFFKYDF